jgi:ABC-2 type transport system permease protein
VTPQKVNQVTLLDVERIKLLSTRSPWWCAIVALGLTIGFTSLIAAYSDFPLTVPATQFSYQFGLMVVMVMAALAVTTEYRFGTIKATFQAVPDRIAVLGAKTAVVAAFALIIGLAGAFGSWGAAQALAPSESLSLNSADAWRQVAGVGPVFAAGAILAVAIGILLRQTAGAVTLILVWSQLVETLIVMIPSAGPDIQKWMPFTMASHFLRASGSPAMDAAEDMPFGPWGSLAYFAAIAVALLALALETARRRDA